MTSPVCRDALIPTFTHGAAVITHTGARTGITAKNAVVRAGGRCDTGCGRIMRGSAFPEYRATTGGVSVRDPRYRRDERGSPDKGKLTECPCQSDAR